jgi:hypothetical protein
MIQGELQEQAFITPRNTPSTGEDFRVGFLILMLI